MPNIMQGEYGGGGQNPWMNILGSLISQAPTYTDPIGEIVASGADINAFLPLVQQQQSGQLGRREAASREEELRARQQERARQIEQQRRMRDVIQSPEVLGQLSKTLRLPPELISGAGSIEELGALGRLTPAATADPSAVREYQYFQSLPEDQREGYLAVKRAQQIRDIGGQIVSVDPITGQPTTVAQKTLPPEQTLEHIKAVEEAKVAGGGKITPVQQRAYNRAESRLAADTGLRTSIAESENINQVIDEALGQASGWTTGLGSLTGIIPGTPAADLQANLRTIQADAAFSSLQNMRDRSKTGGALGQVSERELGLLSAARAALEASQSPEQFKRNLERYKKVRATALENTKRAYKEEFGVEFSLDDEGDAPANGSAINFGDLPK